MARDLRNSFQIALTPILAAAVEEMGLAPGRPTRRPRQVPEYTASRRALTAFTSGAAVAAAAAAVALFIGVCWFSLVYGQLQKASCKGVNIAQEWRESCVELQALPTPVVEHDWVL